MFGFGGFGGGYGDPLMALLNDEHESIHPAMMMTGGGGCHPMMMMGGHPMMMMGGYGHPMMMGGGMHPAMMMAGGGGGYTQVVTDEGLEIIGDMLNQEIQRGSLVYLTHEQNAEVDRRMEEKLRGGSSSSGGSSIDGEVMIMYHGTSESSARAIESGGFRVSEDGMLGKGVYCSRDIDKAKAYGSIVLRLSVRTGRVKRIDAQGHSMQKNWHAQIYDTACVPPNTMNPSGKEEDCVRDPGRITVLGRAAG
jgi:hypothetical protein